MADFILYASIALSSITALCGVLLLLGYGKRTASENLADIVTAASLRIEADRIRADSAEQARSIRLEIAQVMRGFQDTMMQRLDAGVEQIRTPINGIGQKLDAGIAKMGEEASQGRDTLRSMIEAKLDSSSALLSNSARELREELIGNFEKTSNVLSSTMKELGNQQLKRLGEVAEALKTMSDSQTNAQESLRTSIEAKLDASNTSLANSARELREELIGNFEKTSNILSSTIRELGTQQLERLERVAEELKGLSERQANAQEGLRQTVETRLDAIRTENSAKLDEMRQTVDEKLQTALEKRLGESFRTVSEQLERVYQGLGEMQKLANDVGDFKRVLTNVKVRGTWGEVLLEMLLQQFLTPDQYMKQPNVKCDSSERVDFAIKLPGHGTEDVLLPVDSKFPNDDYDRLVQASERADSAAVADAVSALEDRARSEAKKISEKYINPPVTTDFAIMYLSTEGLYAEILRRPGLQEQLQRQFRVIVAGPTTLAALLNALQVGFRSLAIEKRSSEVWQILGAVRTEFAAHGKIVAKLKKQLSAASNTVEKLGTRTNVMNSKLKDVERLPDGTAQALLGLVAPVTDALDETDYEDLNANGREVAEEEVLAAE